MASLGRRRRVGVLLLVLVGVVHGGSVMAYRGMRVDPADFKTFAAMLATQVEKTDLIFLQPNWSVTPILYYMTGDRYRLVGDGYREACRQNPDARVWVLLFYQQEITTELADALARYQVVRQIEVPYVRAVLYSPKPLEPSASP
jgi:hypothetical protein